MSGPWPDLPDGWEQDRELQAFRAKRIVEAEVELEVNRRTPRTASPPSPNPVETMAVSLEQKLHETLYTLSTGSIDRSRTGAQFVQTAASAIGGLYTGILAVIFVSDTPVPARGFLPTLFFGAAIALATAYLAFVQRLGPMPRPKLWGSVHEDIWQRTNFLARYARAIVLQRAPLLRAGVVALAFGVVLLPAALLRAPRVTSPAEELGSATAGSVSTGGSSAPSASPTPIAWPTPPAVQPAEVAAVLYQHQLDRYVATLDSATARTDETAENAIAWSIAALGAVVVFLTAMNRMFRDRVDDPSGSVVMEPAAGATKPGDSPR